MTAATPFPRLRGAVIDDGPSDAEDDGIVVPIGSAPHAGSRHRHPAGGALRLTAGAEEDDPWPTAPDDLEDGLPSERSIAYGLVEGRRWALAAAFERWADLVHGVARQLVGHDHADDVTQQVFVEAWRSRRSFSPDRGEVPGWLVGITRNVARTHLRERGPAHLEVDDELDADETAPAADVVVDHLVVANAFRDLPAHQREVLELTLLREFTQSEAADHLGIPLGTVKTRHRRGLKALRASLQGAVA